VADVRLSALLTQYLSGVSTLAAFPTLPDELLNARPAAGAPSAGEVIVHLSQTEIAWSSWFRQILMTDGPQLVEWALPAATAPLHYDRRSIVTAVGTIAALRHDNVDLFAALTPAQWRRTGEHPELGPTPLRHLVLLASTTLSEELARARRAVNGSS
jgi:hypothetical protein